MENFFIEDSFYSDLSEYLEEYDIDEDSVSGLAEDWSVEVEDSKFEKIFVLKEDWVVDRIIEDTDMWEDRFPEDSDSVFEKIKKAIRESIDISKMNELLPSLYYPNGKKYNITKADVVSWLK